MIKLLVYYIRYFSILALVLLLMSGCALNNLFSDHQPVPKASSWRERQQALLAVTSWQLRGRVALKFSVNTNPANTNKQRAANPPQSFSANLFWRQLDKNYDIELFGPIGLGAVKLLGSPGSIVLTDSHKHRYQATSPEALMQQQLGWSLPVSELYYWIRGLPAPDNRLHDQVQNNQVMKFDALWRITEFEQANWHIVYESYQAIAGHWLPRKIRLSTENLQVLIVINDILILNS